MSPKKTIVVTGISGYFGQSLWPLLEADPEIERVVGIDSRPLPSRPGPGSKLVFYEQDIRQVEWADFLTGADALVHLAFILMRLPKSGDIDEVNRAASQRIFAAAARYGVRKLVVTSSVVAYGMHPDNPMLLTEETPLRPNAGLYYGQAKAANEAFLDRFARERPDILLTRLRPCTVIGPHADPAQMASLTGKTSVLVRGYNPPVQLLHEADLASALHLAIQRDLPGIYNAVSDEPYTLKELVKLRGGRAVALPYDLARGLMAIAWRLGLSPFAPEWIDLSRYSLVASNIKLKRAGWRPRYTTPQAFADLLNSQGSAAAAHAGVVERKP